MQVEWSSSFRAVLRAGVFRIEERRCNPAIKLAPQKLCCVISSFCFGSNINVANFYEWHMAGW